MQFTVSPRTPETIDRVMQHGLAGLDFETGPRDLRNAYADSWRLIYDTAFADIATDREAPFEALRKLFEMAEDVDRRHFVKMAMLGFLAREGGRMTSSLLFGNGEDAYYDDVVLSTLTDACREIETVDTPEAAAARLLNFAASVTLMRVLEPDAVARNIDDSIECARLLMENGLAGDGAD